MASVREDTLSGMCGSWLMTVRLISRSYGRLPLISVVFVAWLHFGFREMLIVVILGVFRSFLESYLLTIMLVLLILIDVRVVVSVFVFLRLIT